MRDDSIAICAISTNLRVYLTVIKSKMYKLWWKEVRHAEGLVYYIHCGKCEYHEIFGENIYFTILPNNTIRCSFCCQSTSCDGFLRFT